MELLICMMLQNKNLEIKILQLQFQEQKSELCLSLCSEKQNELHSLMGSLEEKYKTLVAAALESQRQEYFMVFLFVMLHSNFIYFSLLPTFNKSMRIVRFEIKRVFFFSSSFLNLRNLYNFSSLSFSSYIIDNYHS